nr:gustatory receptor 16 [Bactrocera minax]
MSGVNGQPQQFLQSFNTIFYLCKLFGVYPYDFQKFYYQGKLQGSRLGSCVVVTVMCIAFVLFNLTLFTFSDEKVIAKNSEFREIEYSIYIWNIYILVYISPLIFVPTDHLSLIVTIVFTYITPATMFTDQITAIRNQKSLPELFERIDFVDRDLRQLGITVDNRRVQRSIWLMIAFTFFSEFFIFFSSIWLLVDEMKWTTALWIFTSLPTLYNTMDKIWFLGILLGLRDRFDVINAELEKMAVDLEKKTQTQQPRGQLYQQSELVLQTSLPLHTEQIGGMYRRIYVKLKKAFYELLSL